MKVGVPKEIAPGETRVAATPDTVGRMVKGGMEVCVESGAGLSSYMTDEEYAKAGAKVVAGAEELYAQSGAVIKVRRPGMNDHVKKHEADLLKEGSIVIAFLQPLASLDVVMKLKARKITSFSMEFVPRISRAQMMDALSSMSTVAGYKAVIMAADHLKKLIPMLSTAAGTIQPARAVVIGAGVAGLQAISTAKRLGAVVVGFDTRPAAGEQIKSLGADFVPLDVAHDQAEDSGGYAKEMSADFYKAEQEIIRKEAKNADIIVSTALVPGKPAPTLITEEMVKEMRPGSVIVDLVAEQGGNCAVTEAGKITVKHNVTIIGTLNLPAECPINSSQLYARNMLNFLYNLAPDKKEINLNLEDEIIKGSLITHNGEITNAAVREAVKKAEISYPGGPAARSHW